VGAAARQGRGSSRRVNGRVRADQLTGSSRAGQL